MHYLYLNKDRWQQDDTESATTFKPVVLRYSWSVGCSVKRRIECKTTLTETVIKNHTIKVCIMVNKHTANHLSAQRCYSGRLFDKWLPTVNLLSDSHFWFDHSFQALFQALSIKWFILRLSSLRYPLFSDTPRGDTHCQTISSCQQYRCFDSRTCTECRHSLSENFTSCLANN